MASHPDANPDSAPPGRTDDVERVSEIGTDGTRVNITDTPGDGNSVDSPGTPGGGGTGGVNDVQEDLDR